MFIWIKLSKGQSSLAWRRRCDPRYANHIDDSAMRTDDLDCFLHHVWSRCFRSDDTGPPVQFLQAMAKVAKRGFVAR